MQAVTYYGHPGQEATPPDLRNAFLAQLKGAGLTVDAGGVPLSVGILIDLDKWGSRAQLTRVIAELRQAILADPDGPFPEESTQ